MSKVWVFGDYSQAEARVVAWRGPVPRLKQWFKDNEDIHINLAKLIAKIVQQGNIPLPRPGTNQRDLFSRTPWDKLTKSVDSHERDIAKNCNHANNYGVESAKFALMTGLPEPIARVIQAMHFKIFPEIKTGYQRWIDDCLRSNSTIITPLGRRHTFYDRPSPDRSRSAYSLYAQNTIGDLLSLCMGRLHECFDSVSNFRVVSPDVLVKCGLDIALQEHDAVGVRSEESRVDETCKLIKDAGEIPLEIAGDTLIVPMEFKVGPSWGEAKEYKYQDSFEKAYGV